MTIEKDLGLGPTGEFPQGKLNDDDEGELTIAIGIENGKVVIRFGKEVAWLGMDADGARGMAASLIRKADELAITAELRA